MSFARPTLSQINGRVATDIEVELPGADARLRHSNLNALARMSAGQAHLLYGYLDFNARQILPDTAEAEFVARHATIWGIARKAAAFAAGTLTFTGVNGTAIPAGTELTRSDGAVFITDAEGAIAGGTASIAVTAALPGAGGNTAEAVTLTLTGAIAGLVATATVAAGGLIGGTDTETDAALRARLLARIRQAPHGGAAFDYLAWALEVPGVTRAWVFPNELGLGAVTVRFVLDGDAGGLIPNGAKVTEVQDYIDARRPVTAEVTVIAPVAVALDFTIQLTPDTAAVRAAVEAELADLLLREAEPGGTILISHLREAVSIAAGETDHVMTVPAANDVRAAGELSVMGAVTWV